MEIIPAIDIIGGKCVRLEKGDYSKKKTYAADPLLVAKSFEKVGIRRLHLVDLDGAKAQHVVNISTLKSITSHTSLQIDFGGGIKSRADLDKAFAAGARQVTGGSVAAQNRPLFCSWIEEFGSEKMVLGADVLDKQIMVSGWQEGTSIDLMDFLSYYTELGIRYVICTDISKDGMLQGPAIDLYKEILSVFPDLQLIASGGVSSMADLEALENAGLYGAIVGKAFYEGKIALEDLANF